MWLRDHAFKMGPIGTIRYRKMTANQIRNAISVITAFIW